MFLVLDPDGVIVRVVETEAEFDKIRGSHLAGRLQAEIPRDMDEESRLRLARERAREILPRYKLICL